MAHTWDSSLKSMDELSTQDPELTQILADYQAKLATYGTVEALALFFQEAGIQALPGNSDRCAVAVHAQATLDLPEDVQLRVGGSSIMLTRDTVVETTESEMIATWGKQNADLAPMMTTTQREIVASVDHDSTVSTFVDKFDHYDYPDLVKPEVLAEKRAKAEKLAMSIKAHNEFHCSPMTLATFKKLIADPIKYEALENASKVDWGESVGWTKVDALSSSW